MRPSGLPVARDDGDPARSGCFGYILFRPARMALSERIPLPAYAEVLRDHLGATCLPNDWTRGLCRQVTLLTVYYLSTCSYDGSMNMNIFTFYTPVNTRPVCLFSLGMYEGTLSAENFERGEKGILQLLRPGRADLVRVLGGTSGRDVGKARLCAELGYAWTDPAGGNGPLILSRCAHYAWLRQVGAAMDGGSHAVVLCEVEEIFVPDGGADGARGEDGGHLSTGALKSVGIISELGRVVIPKLLDGAMCYHLSVINNR